MQADKSGGCCRHGCGGERVSWKEREESQTLFRVSQISLELMDNFRATCKQRISTALDKQLSISCSRDPRPPAIHQNHHMSNIISSPMPSPKFIESLSTAVMLAGLKTASGSCRPLFVFTRTTISEIQLAHSWRATKSIFSHVTRAEFKFQQFKAEEESSFATGVQQGGQSRTSASEFISGLVGALETIFRCKLSKDHKTIRIMASLRILLLLRLREHFSRAYLVEIV